MKKITIIILCFFVVLVVRAQVPGYQGKRTVIEAHVSVPIIGSGSNAPNIYKLHGEYAIKRTKTIGVELRYSNQGADFDGSDEFQRGTFIRKSILVSYNFYTQGWSLAPYGRYLSYGLALTSVEGKVPVSNAKVPLSTSAIYPSIHFAFGKRYILAKRITLNWGSETALPLTVDSYRGRGDAAGILFNVHVGLGAIF